MAFESIEEIIDFAIKNGRVSYPPIPPENNEPISSFRV